MMRLARTAAIVFLWGPLVWPAAPVPLTTLQAVSALSNDEARRQLPVAFEATVNFYARNLKNLDVQDGDRAVYVKLTKDAELALGDRVLIEGTTQPSFLPYVLSTKVTVLRHGALPAPVDATYDDLVGTKVNCRLVRVRGVVRAADLVSSQVAPSGRVQLLMEGGYVDLEVDNQDAGALRNLLDAQVEVVGAAGRKFDGKMQQSGVKLKVSSLAGIKILNRPSTSPWSLPVTPLGEIITGYHVHDLSQRLRVHGTITYYQPGTAVVLQDGPRSLWVSTQTSEPLAVGDVADATGFPETRDNLLSLAHAEIQDSRVQAPIQPQLATWRQLALWGRSVLGGHQYDLVSIEGRVVTEVREADQDEYVLVSDGQLLTAVYRHPPPPNPSPPLLQVPQGATIRVAGICVPTGGDPFNDEEPFNILLRSFDDITVVANPPLLNTRTLSLIVGLLLLVLGALGARGWVMERKVRQQTATLGYLEHRRSRILEDINGSRPLAEIIEQITEVVSCKLKGAPCWCQIPDEGQLGNCPRDLTAMRIVQHEIPARSGVPLGAIFAAFHPLVKPRAIESEALSMAAGLATLAIETRHLYADLLRRSEFDMLTDIQNRFSLERHLEAQIEQARKTASSFGLIYIDLDAFKGVNDEHGHQTGDLYLQEATMRMKRQLRPGDVLARVGGDEFAAVVKVGRSRADVEEIALRLERCFDDPFALEGRVLCGSASVGLAVFPQDGTTKDSLLNVADSAMYAAKKCKQSVRELLTER